jgi:hypothetical protein
MSYTYKTPLGDKLVISAADEGSGHVVLQIVSAMGTASVPLPVELRDVDGILSEIRGHALVAGNTVAARYRAENDAQRGRPLASPSTGSTSSPA